jgi:hypothetical protein
MASAVSGLEALPTLYPQTSLEEQPITTMSPFFNFATSQRSFAACADSFLISSNIILYNLSFLLFSI